MDTINTEARNADLPDLVDMLKEQSDCRYDVVVPSSALEMRGGDLLIKGGAARITDEGVETEDARLVLSVEKRQAIQQVTMLDA